MKIVSNPSIAPYPISKNEKQSKELEKSQSNNCDTVEISSKQEKTVIDDNTSYTTFLKEFVKNNNKTSALAEIIKNTSTPKKDEPSPEEIRRICMKIAARIRKGDKVPVKDLRYLLKKDPQLYQMAMINKKPNDNPKKWKQLSPDEDDIALSNKGNENNSSESSGTCQSPSISVSTSSGETN